MIHLKSTREIEKLRQSGHLVGRTLAEVAKHIRPGVSTIELDKVADDFIHAHNAKPAFKGYSIGRLVFPNTLCISVNDVIVHGIPGDLVLQEGDLVSVDCGVFLDGYFGDSAYTFAVGELSEENAQLCRITYESLLKGIDNAVVGKRMGDLSSAIEEHCAAYGYGIVRDLVGHGIGRSLHEDPQVPNFGRRGTGRKLKKGLTLCIEPMINRGTAEVTTDADGWTVRTEDRLPSAHYEHMVSIEGGKADVLTTFEYIEEVIGNPPYVPKEEVTHG